MQLVRPAYAPDPRRFGRRLTNAVALPRPARAMSEDLKLFALTFGAGFLFVSILIG